MLGVILPQAHIYLCSLFVGRDEFVWQIGNSLSPPLGHQLASKDNNSNSSGRHYSVEWIRQAGDPLVGEGRMRGMPGFSISSTSCSAPAGRLSAGIAPNPSPQHGTPHPIRGQQSSANRTVRFRRTRPSTGRVRAAASSMPRAKDVVYADAVACRAT